MPKKLEIDFIKSEFEKEGYQLLTTEYKNSRQKLDYICPNGHRYSISWGNWSQDKRCLYCSGKVKLTIDFIKSEFEKEGYQLLTTDYKNNRQKLNYICPNGHKHSIKWNDWRGGYKCPYCAGNVKLDIDFIKSEFEKAGYQLLTTEYINNKQKLDYICSSGHYHSIKWNDWKQGYRCSDCYHIKQLGSGHPNWKGGISKLPYCQEWTKEYKSEIKERDGFMCLNPKCNSKNSDDLVVHHIDYTKTICGPQNLITVCRSCNARANKNREFHTKFYRNILSELYNYKY